MKKNYGFVPYDGFANDIARVVNDIPYLTSEGFTREANARLHGALFEKEAALHEHDWRWNLAQPGEIVCSSPMCGYTHRSVRDWMGDFHYTDMPRYTGTVPCDLIEQREALREALGRIAQNHGHHPFLDCTKYYDVATREGRECAICIARAALTPTETADA